MMIGAPNKNYSKQFTYLMLGVAGLSIIGIASLFQKIVIPKEQQDFLHYLNYNFTKTVGLSFFMVGLVIGYFLKLNPWTAGLCLFIVFPLTTVIDATINVGDHNLLPFEFLMYFLYALPSILALYLGKFIAERMAKRKEKDLDQD